MPRRCPRAGRRALGLALFFAAVLPSAATAQLPDLVADPAEDPTFGRYPDPVGETPDDTSLLLRFSGYVHNIGPAPLDLWGTVPGLTQYTTGVDAGSADRLVAAPGASAAWSAVSGSSVPVTYEPYRVGGRFQVRDAVEYTLWDLAGTTQILGPSRNDACFGDIEPDPTPLGPDAPIYGTALDPVSVCGQDQPTSTTVRMGISEGYRAVLDADLDRQWLDVSRVPPGRYRIGTRVDPANHIAEANEANNGVALSEPVTVPGFRAAPVSVTVRPGASVDIPLSATRFDATAEVSPEAPFGYADAGAPRYRVDSLPGHGRLTDAAGRAVAPGWTGDADPTALRYTSDGSLGVDTFTYSTLNIVGGAVSRYPLAPPSSQVSITVGVSTPLTTSGGPKAVVRKLRVFRRVLSGRTLRLTVRAPISGRAIGVVRAAGRVVGRCRVSARRGRILVCRVRLPRVYDAGALVADLRIVRGAVQYRRRMRVGRGVVVSMSAVRRGPRLTTRLRTRTSGSATVTPLPGKGVRGTCSAPVSRGRTLTCRFVLRSGARPRIIRAVLTDGRGRRVVYDRAMPRPKPVGGTARVGTPR